VLPTIQQNTIEFARLSRLYTARSSAHPALAAYPTLDALLSTLHGPRRADPVTRRRLLCAVIAEHQATPSPLWSAIALHVFRGMLAHLLKGLRGVDDRNEAQGLVVAGLLEALMRVRPERDPDRIAMYVRQETRRVVFAAVRRDTRARQYWPAEEEEACSGDDDPSGEEPVGAEEESSSEDGWDDDATFHEAPRDPLAREAASREVAPDTLADPETVVPIEDRMLFCEPMPSNIPDEVLLRAHAVRGGLRRLTHHLFADASARHREHVYRLLLRRTQRLLAHRK
jgi:hypothetical protein